MTRTRIAIASLVLPLAAAITTPAFAASTATTAAPAAKVPAAAPAAAAPAAGAATAKVNINTATSAELQTVKGVGPKMAKEIMEYRPYKNFAKLEQKLTKYFPLKTVKAVEPSFSL